MTSPQPPPAIHPPTFVAGFLSHYPSLVKDDGQWLVFSGVVVRVSARMGFPSGSSCVLWGEVGRSILGPPFWSLYASVGFHPHYQRIGSLHFRSRGTRLWTYPDDWLILVDSSSLCLFHLQEFLSLSSSLGFLPNWKKSDLSPFQRFHFLGMVLTQLS